MSANGLSLSVVGDNIANANTVGFKAGRASFEDSLAQTVIGGSGEIGLGVRVQSVQKILSQGALTLTGLATDMALGGKRFGRQFGNLVHFETLFAA
jgi:flagellar hook protein FlgE